MSEAIVLAAGVGSRLACVHGGLPKCLVPVAGRPMLDWQLQALTAVGVERVVIVLGHEADQVRAHARSLRLPLVLRFVINDRYLSTNVLASWRLGSCELTGDHLYMHGDTVFELELLHRLLAVECTGVTLSVDRHPCADEEMKVIARNRRVTSITKEMDPSGALGEFTGVLRAAGHTLSTLRVLADRLLAGPQGPKAFFEAALQEGIDTAGLLVEWVDVTGVLWREIDFPEDLAAAHELMSAVAGPP